MPCKKTSSDCKLISLKQVYLYLCKALPVLSLLHVIQWITLFRDSQLGYFSNIPLSIIYKNFTVTFRNFDYIFLRLPLIFTFII